MHLSQTGVVISQLLIEPRTTVSCSYS